MERAGDGSEVLDVLAVMKPAPEAPQLTNIGRGQPVMDSGYFGWIGGDDVGADNVALFGVQPQPSSDCG